MITPLGGEAGTWVMAGGALLARDPDEAYAIDPHDAFIHGVVERDDGFRVLGFTWAKPAVVEGQPKILYYRRPGDTTFFRFSFSLVRGGNTGDGSGRVSGPSALGLSIDSDWIEDYLGGGARLVMDAATSEGRIREPLYDVDGFPMFFDSRGYRWAMPWVVAQPVSIERDRVRWRVVTRYGDPPSGGSDVWGRWSLAAFNVEVALDEGGEIVATPSGLIRYNPFTSSDPSRVAAEDGDGTKLNMFGFPAVATGGAVLIPHVALVYGVNPGMGTDGSNFSFNAVLLNEAGQFVEVGGLPADLSMEMGIPCYGKLRSLFFGGDSGVLINPFVAAGVIALVDTQDGGTTLLPRPTLQIPLALSLMPGQRQNRMYYTDDLCKNMVGRLRDGVICFPVQTESSVDTGDVKLVTLDIATGELEVRGALVDAATIEELAGGISKPGTVQYEEVNPQTGEVVSPGILLWGAHNDSGGGRTCISYDSGVTWYVISNAVGPARAIWYAGSAIHAPPPGMLWG